MSNQENVIADIQQILDTFDNFVNIYELDNWLKDATVEAIKNSFKLAMFVEDTIKDLQAKQCIDNFKNTLNLWWKTKNRTKVYDVPFFSTACDHLLSRFFTNGSTKVNNIDIAVRIYTSMHSRDKFENFLSNLILKSSSYATLFDYALTTKDDSDLNELQNQLLLRNWSIEKECGRIDGVKTVIANMLSSYKINTSLPTLINILTLDNVRDQERMVQNAILTDLLSKMSDRSILSTAFWFSFFRHVEKKHLSIVCVKYDDFLKELLNFITYVGCMMNSEIINNKIVWVVDSASICPDITYDELIDLVRCLCNYNINIKNYIKSRISEAKLSANLKLWEQLETNI